MAVWPGARAPSRPSGLPSPRSHGLAGGRRAGRRASRRPRRSATRPWSCAGLTADPHVVRRFIGAPQGLHHDAAFGGAADGRSRGPGRSSGARRRSPLALHASPPGRSRSRRARPRGRVRAGLPDRSYPIPSWIHHPTGVQEAARAGRSLALKDCSRPHREWSAHASAQGSARRRPCLRRGDPVPDTGLGDDQAGERAIDIERLELPADLAHVDMDVVCFLAVRGSPHRAEQTSVRDQSAGIGQEDLQDLVFARGEMDDLPRTLTVRCAISIVRSPKCSSPSVAAAGPAARRSRASILARSSTIPNGLVT